MCYSSGYGNNWKPALEPVTAVLLGQYAVTLASSGFNAVYFWSYRSQAPGRRVGAVVMAFLSLATFLESLALGLADRSWAPLHSAPWMASRILVALASLSITALILRRWLERGL